MVYGTRVCISGHSRPWLGATDIDGTVDGCCFCIFSSHAYWFCLRWNDGAADIDRWSEHESPQTGTKNGVSITTSATAGNYAQRLFTFRSEPIRSTSINEGHWKSYVLKVFFSMLRDVSVGLDRWPEPKEKQRPFTAKTTGLSLSVGQWAFGNRASVVKLKASPSKVKGTERRRRRRGRQQRHNSHHVRFWRRP